MTAIYTDLLANASAWDTGNSDGVVGTDRIINKDIAAFQARQGGLEYASAYTAKDEVIVLAAHVATVSGGNFTLTITLFDGTSITTANIAHDATQATIESAIDTAATGNITSWTNSDISVALTANLVSNAATFTFDGDSVKEVNNTLVANDVDLSGGGSLGAVTTTTNGQPIRRALAALNAMGVLTSSLPAQGATTVTAATTRASNNWFPRQETLQALAMQAVIDDSTDGMYASIMTAVGLSHLL